MQTINILIHIVAGLLAIAVGLGPYFTKKGGRRHRLWGKAFLLLMCVVILTSLNGVFFFRDRPFLTIVTFLSFYTTYSGYRVLKTKEKGFAHLDFGVMVFVLLVATAYTIKMDESNVLWHNSVVYYLLIYLFVLLIFDITRYFLPGLIRVKNF